MLIIRSQDRRLQVIGVSSRTPDVPPVLRRDRQTLRGQEVRRTIVGGAAQRISMRTRPSAVVTGTQLMVNPVRLVREAFRFMGDPSSRLALRGDNGNPRWTEDERKVNERWANSSQCAIDTLELTSPDVVTLIGFLLAPAAFAGVPGIVTIAFRDTASVLEATGATSSELLIAGILALVGAGILALVVAGILGPGRRRHPGPGRGRHPGPWSSPAFRR